MLSHEEVSLHMMPNSCIEVHTSPLNRPSVPEWFAEVVIMVQHLAKKGLVDACARASCVWCADASGAMNLLIFSPC